MEPKRDVVRTPASGVWVSMKRASVYSASAQPGDSAREALIHERLEHALAALADIERHWIDVDGSAARAQSVPGLMQVTEIVPVIALGHDAHVALSSLRKRTLMARDLDLDDESGDDARDEIERLVWSSVNTTKLVALGARVWESIQLLPIDERRFYRVPPLQMCTADQERQGILVINHDGAYAATRAVTAALRAAGMDVRCTGVPEEAHGLSSKQGWDDDSSIHVHVGVHTLDSEEIRLVDSWHSERLTLQLAAPRDSRRPGSGTYLMIDDEANGFICATPTEILKVCRELSDDRVLQRKLIAVGQSSVAPLLKSWDALAADLLA